MFSGDRRRRNFTAGDNNFTFFPVSDHLEYRAWAENLKRDHSFSEQNRSRRFGPWSRTIRLSESSFSSSSSSSFEFSYDASSPPLWKSASTDCNPSGSRAEKIEEKRKEMMDLVRNLPETAYELSLKDLVELVANERREEEGEKKGRVRRRLGNGGLYSGGFLLKLFMPSVPGVFGSRGKISPRPIVVGSDGGWMGERNSSSGSCSGSSCGRGRRRWKLGGCYPFWYGLRRSRSR